RQANSRARGDTAGLIAANDQVIAFLGALDRADDDILGLGYQIRVALRQRAGMVGLGQRDRAAVQLGRAAQRAGLRPAAGVRQQRIAKALDALVDKAVWLTRLGHGRVVVGIDRATQHGHAHIAIGD